MGSRLNIQQMRLFIGYGQGNGAAKLSPGLLFRVELFAA